LSTPSTPACPSKGLTATAWNVGCSSACPDFALERWREIDSGQLVYESIKLGPGGSVSLMLPTLELSDRLAALIPPPRWYRHRYYGVLAPGCSGSVAFCGRKDQNDCSQVRCGRGLSASAVPRLAACFRA